MGASELLLPALSISGKNLALGRDRALPTPQFLLVLLNSIGLALQGLAARQQNMQPPHIFGDALFLFSQLIDLL